MNHRVQTGRRPDGPGPIGFMGSYLLALSPTILWVLLVGPSQAALSTTMPAVVTDRFTLIPFGETFALKDAHQLHVKPVVIPHAWLSPPNAEIESLAVNASAYQPQVTAFSIGNGLWGLHLASFEAMTSGSLQAAAGRDVFLVYDVRTRQVQPGLVTLGLTKSRARAEGCMTATATHFLISDFQGDGLTDLGVVMEEIACVRDAGGAPDLEPLLHPRYRQEPIQWFLFDRGQWRQEVRDQGKMPPVFVELPLLSIRITPVDFAACLHQPWGSYDPQRWGTHEDKRTGQSAYRFVPAYRQKLIEKGAQC